MRNQSLQFMIYWAYSTPPFEINGPDWINDTRFDVIAKSDSGGDDAKLRLMVQTLLADRFGLKTHKEQKEMQASLRDLRLGQAALSVEKDCWWKQKPRA